MTTRMEILDLIDLTLTDRLGREKVSRRDDGVLIVAGSSEAFLVQALVVDAPQGVDVFNFGKDLVEFIRTRCRVPTHAKAAPANDDQVDEQTFHTCQNGDTWFLTTDVGG